MSLAKPPDVASKSFKGWLFLLWKQLFNRGTFTPAFTFVTPGNLAVSYSSQLGYYTRIADMVFVNIVFITSSFTHSTASGDLTITGLPFTSANDAGRFWTAPIVQWTGFTKAGYSALGARLGNNSDSMVVIASGSAVTAARVQASDMPTGGTIVMLISLAYSV